MSVQANKGAGAIVSGGPASGGPAPPLPHAPTHAPQTGTDPLASGDPPSTVEIGDAADPGTADMFALADHVHAVAAPALPQAQATGAGSTGVATTPARADHVHPMAALAPAAHAATHAPQLGSDPLATAPAGTWAIGSAAATGVANSLARSDHVHAVPAPTVVSTVEIGDAADPGVSASPAREDHVHEVPPPATSTDVLIDGSGSSVGSGTRFARDTHSHALVGLGLNGFRLSPDAASPVPTANALGGSVIYLLPYTGRRLMMATIIAGSPYLLESAGASFDMAASPRTAGRPFDLFARNLAGVLTLEAVDWASATARATALAYQDGILTRAGTPAQRYLGTVYARTATTYDWSPYPADETAAHLDVWNYSNRCRVGWRVRSSAASWTQPVSGVWRGANGGTWGRVELVCGVREDFLNARLVVGSDNTASSRAAAIGLDSTTAPAADCNYGHAASSPLEVSGAELATQPAIGFHFAQWIERAQAATPTWFGTLADNYRYGLHGAWAA